MQNTIARLFNLQGWVVYRCQVNDDAVDIYVGRPRKEAACSHCGHKSHRVHARSGHWRRVLHTRAAGRPVYLRPRPRRFRCLNCATVFTEPLPGLRPWSRLTAEAESVLLSELAGRSFRSAARAMGTGPGVLRRTLLRRVSSQVDAAQALSGLAEVVLGIDEHSFRGPDLMITVTCVCPERRLVAILRDDRSATLEGYLRRLPDSVKQRVVGVCVDMKPAWRKLVERALPQARLVLDPFHVIQDANRRLDEARRIEQEISRCQIPRWPLVKNEAQLSRRQAAQLAVIRARHKNVAHFHAVKERLRGVYQAPSRSAATQILDQIIFHAELGDDAAMVQWSRTLRAWREPILAHHDLRVSNGYTEGVHTKIKLLKRLSYGFRNREIYMRKMLLSLVPLAWLAFSSHLLT